MSGDNGGNARTMGDEAASQAGVPLLDELVADFREKRELLRQQWVEQMRAKELLAGLSEDQTETQSAAIYDSWVDCLETGRYDRIQAFSALVAERSAARGVTPERVLGAFVVLREVHARRFLHRYEDNMAKVLEALDVYLPVADRILSIVATAFFQEREKLVRQQQEAIRELSTPVLRVRDRLLILPIIGLLDTQRARQLTEQLLYAIRANRAKVVIMDITGVASMDSKVANHLVQTVEAAQLLGTKVIVTGISPETAQMLVTIGVDLSRLHTIGDLQGGLEEADRLLGTKPITA